MRVSLAVLTLWMLAGCSGQNLIHAHDVREELVGLSDEKILACMGRPQGRFHFRGTEVWQYNSGGLLVGTANVQPKKPMGTGASVASPRYCIVNIAMSNKAVRSVSYIGMTGLPLQDEHCVSAVKACLQQ